MINIWTNNPLRWLADITSRAEEIKELETKLIESRGAIAELKRMYFISYLKENDIFTWQHPKALINEKTYILNDIVQIGDGDCVLNFANVLKSGKRGKGGCYIHFDGVAKIKWLSKDG